ncbi:hypothetical protein COW99_00400 [Candidatus Roizmanbacteria bacterium CG22_combo_CG10-13_8_21_14_all_38_20]|uniref:BrnT family toxin n=1 Tax=Candidatus Roizmanbacteria bacterium CG22_combo_CG10-13_8_21_14_all_38_20 TaxID=1974862 RepID=A0A2H0BWT7_9BACT|nr:BrnT family toxin [Candidatus Microgenomates bacterium]PIP62132.1 MAG: hypothetical protein COW99_00400 [Candidatus Roizmanbacteria bacterium CG22_combo_CG10-13_8_21_14_all_38_20]PJC31858.1 MAG: hypothetical protein CO050_02090 [Candidatus Roizmanbacteria bacterium CG_4_9_14_0_2_um_filter_38_17]
MNCIGNRDKNLIKHKVVNKECEEVFFNQPLIINSDSKHFKNEYRYQALGKTSANRLLFIAFTHRNRLIRIISARDQNKKERRQYEKA